MIPLCISSFLFSAFRLQEKLQALVIKEMLYGQRKSYSAGPINRLLIHMYMYMHTF